MALSRRTFISGAAAVPFAVGAKPLQEIGNDAKWSKSVDLVVAGGGLSGLCAAIQAVESGLKSVLVLEKGAFLGGHALISGGGYVASGSQIQRANGVEDSPEKDWQDAVKRGVALNGFLKTDTTVARMIFDEHTKALEWLQKQGVKFEDKPGYGYGNAKRLHYFAPRGPKGNSAAIEALIAKAKEAGVEFMLETGLVELVTKDNTLGSPVTGVLAKGKNGANVLVEARKGVILACGGFGQNPEMVRRFHPYLEGIPCFSSPLSTGDGIKAALALGAAINVTHHDLAGTFASTAVKAPKVRINGFAPSNLPLVIVTKEGARFIDESRGGRYISAEMVTSKNTSTVWILDKDTVEEARERWFKPLFAKEGIVTEYATLEDLAKGEGIAVEALKKTVAEYNEDAKAGKDRVFGKTKLLKELGPAPFYAFAAQPTILYTYTGLWINTKCEVLDTLDRPIQGLYAAGDISGRWDAIVGLGQGGMSGLGLAAVTGRVAGREAAARK